MAFEDLEFTDPIPAYKAFWETSEKAQLSQAALILSLGSLLRPSFKKNFPMSGEAQERFPLPKFYPMERPFSFEKLSEKSAPPLLANQIVEEMYQNPDPDLVFKLISVCMHNPEFPLVQTCAAISWIDLIDVKGPGLETLWRGLTGKADPLIKKIAYTAWERIHQVFQPKKPERSGPPPSGMPIANDQKLAMIVHGTFTFPFYAGDGAIPDWWTPIGDFHDYLNNEAGENVYGKDDYYRWEGGLHDYARDVAAWNLKEWQDHRKLQGIDIITHSHGGNVAMLATQKGAIFGKMIFLSCPVHWDKYQPNPGHFTSVQSIRTLFDLVILADKGGQRFPSNVPEHILPFWFMGHGKTHKPDVWEKQNLARFL